MLVTLLLTLGMMVLFVLMMVVASYFMPMPIPIMRCRVIIESCEKAYS